MRSWMRCLTVAVALLAIVAIVVIVRNARQTALPAGLPSDALALVREGGLTPDEHSIDRFVNIGLLLVCSQFVIEHVEVKQSQQTVWHLTNLERTRDATHGFTLSGCGLSASLELGEFCSALHLEMMGYLLVEP